MNKFYITTAIAYTNAPPHIGFALELIQADVLARYHRQRGFDTYFVTGTDEHGTKIARAALAAGKDPQSFVDDIAGQFRDLTEKLNISNDDFIRTTDRTRHWPAVNLIWERLVEQGDLYKKSYEGLYCAGCEAFKRPSELADDLCVIHKTKPETVAEENWFFKVSKYKGEIKQKIESGELKIVPESRKQEILNLIGDSEDVSFSRPKEKLTWGIPVPGDDSQVIYVWADALTNYISVLGFAGGVEQFTKFWPADVHLIGKDIVRFHTIIWPAILLSANLALPRAVYVHGFITVEGEKISKSLGNVIDPFELIKKYGNDVTRYFLLRELPSGDDGDFSYTKLEERYNGDLANGLGNLVQRVVTLIDNSLDGELIYKKEILKGEQLADEITDDTNFKKYIDEFRLHDALADIWKKIGLLNAYINERKPWAEVKENPDGFLKTITLLVGSLHHLAWLLEPFLPGTSQKIFSSLGSDNAKLKEGQKFLVQKGEGLFPRLK